MVVDSKIETEYGLSLQNKHIRRNCAPCVVCFHENRVFGPTSLNVRRTARSRASPRGPCGFFCSKPFFSDLSLLCSCSTRFLHEFAILKVFVRCPIGLVLVFPLSLRRVEPAQPDCLKEKKNGVELAQLDLWGGIEPLRSRDCWRVYNT